MAIREFLKEALDRSDKSHNREEGSPKAPFPEAVREARLLLHFASRHGILLEDKIVEKAVEAAYVEDAKAEDLENTKQIEREFWSAFQRLAEAVKPVTIESIEAIHDSSSIDKGFYWLLRNRKPLARWSVAKYSFFAIVTLVSVISIQMYWVIGKSITNEIVRLEAKIAWLSQEKRSLESNDTSRAKLASEVNTRVDELKAGIMESTLWVEAAYTNLDSWNHAWRTVWSSVVTILRISLDKSNDKKQKQPSLGEEKTRRRIGVKAAEFVLEALSTYIVPILYGLLGAFAYVLREIAKEVRAVTFSHRSRIRYSLRLSLGLLAGIAVGFIFAPDVDVGTVQEGDPVLTLERLGPMALAFLAGYSVELVFAVMDRIVSSFGGENRRR